MFSKLPHNLLKWDCCATFHPLFLLLLPGGPITHFEVSPCKQHLIIARKVGDPQLWHIMSNRIIGTFKGRTTTAEKGNHIAQMDINWIVMLFRCWFECYFHGGMMLNYLWEIPPHPLSTYWRFDFSNVNRSRTEISSFFITIFSYSWPRRHNEKEEKKMTRSDSRECEKIRVAFRVGDRNRRN